MSRDEFDLCKINRCDVAIDGGLISNVVFWNAQGGRSSDGQIQGESPSAAIKPESIVTKIDLWWTDKYLVGLEFMGEKSFKMVKKKQVTVPP